MQQPTSPRLAWLLLSLLLAACQADYAAEGGAGEPCRSDLDCDGLRCMAFVCVEPTPTAETTRILDAGRPDEPDADDPPLGCAPSCLDATTRLLCFEGRTEPEPIPCAPDERCLAGTCIPDEDRCVEGARRCTQERFVERCTGAGWVREEDCAPDSCVPEEAQCQNASSRPNLQMNSLDGAAGTFAPGDPYAFSVAFASSGSIPEGITCEVLLSIDSVASSDDIVLGTYEARLGSPPGVQDALIPDSIVGGFYRLLAFCDRQNRLIESSETDNLADAGELLQVIVPEAPCSTDALEPNNDEQTPASLVVPGQWEELSACGEDDDFYSFCMSSGQNVDISIYFEHEYGDVDMSLHRGAESLDSSSSVGDQERIRALLPVGCYTLRVYLYGVGRSPESRYELTIRFDP